MRSFRRSAFLAAAVVVAAAAALAAPDKDAAPGVAAFETVRAVLQHPRCQNCHIPGDAPLQLDAGRAHTMKIVRGPYGRGPAGLACATCHGSANPPASYGDHQPPGAPGWHMPAKGREMVFIGLSSAELARRLKDPKQNGGKSLAELVDHVTRDPLVLWGWDPGEGRAPVSIPHAEFVAKFREWVEAGAPVPPEK